MNSAGNSIFFQIIIYRRQADIRETKKKRATRKKESRWKRIKIERDLDRREA